MLLVFRDNIKDMANSNYIMGMLIVFLGSVSWAIGTVFSKAKTSETNAFYNAAIQLASGGICCLIYSFFTKEWSSIGEITYSSVLVLLYVTLIGSTAAYAAYQYALTTLPVGVVATYAYINPLIAVILGNLILKERLTWITGSAFILTITGVYLVNKGYNIKRPQNLLNLHH
jgi:drug/metabolite transporter (DMT)-like permease